MPALNVQTITIAQSASVSAAFSVIGASPVAIQFPVVTSANWFLRAAWDATSANYVPLYLTNGSSRFTMNVGPGSVSIVVPADNLAGFGNFKLEAGVSQATSGMSFVIVTKP